MKRLATDRAIAASARNAVAALPMIAALLCGPAAQAQAQEESQAESTHPCGDPFHNHFGPFDYRSAARADVHIVEQYHFTPGVESLTRPASTTFAAMAGDVAYTLHVFPNHHRALLAMMRLGERHKSDQPPGAKFSVECYFDRAVRFRPDDTAARSLYAVYLGKRNRKADAMRQLEAALQQAGDNPIPHYTIGTVYLDLKEFDRALAQAHKARVLGLQRPELEEALRRTGHWKEPPESPAPPASPASTPADGQAR